jgi:hypothetical protein
MDWELLDTVRRDSRFAALIVAALIAPAAQAAVTISSAATQNMTCGNGVCAPTASKAVLNAGDLETLLASGDVEVTTTGEGVQARDITIKAPVGWSSSGVLTLDAQKSIAVDRPMSIAGLAGLTVVTDDGGSHGDYSFGAKGNISFANVSSHLTINGVSFTLIGDLETLASDIAANPSGDFALADDYDARGNGSLHVGTTFNGTFEGLGNVITNFTLGSRRANVGLFENVGAAGVLRDIGLKNATVTGHIRPHRYIAIGGLTGNNAGTVLNSWATGTVGDSYAAIVGGLVGYNEGTIMRSHAVVDVSDSDPDYGGDAGGLVGLNTGTISESYASGTVSGTDTAGGLLDDNEGMVMDSYATGSVDAGDGGGLAGTNGIYNNNYGTISNSYATGHVAAGYYSGGLIGADRAPAGSLTDTYWDTDTSGITNLSQGAGNIANDPGIAGLTTAQFQSGLPAGFDPKVWAEEPNINGGLPYLLANPPPKR